MQENNNKNILCHRIISNLRACGHFLHFRMGGRGGRRRILSTLLEHGELQQRELQDILEVRSGSLSEMLAKIENDGLVEKIRNEQDRRNYNLKLTEKGMNNAIQMQTLYDDKIKQLLSCFTDCQAKDFLAMLDVLLEHWKTMERNGMMTIPDCQHIDSDEKNEEVKIND